MLCQQCGQREAEIYLVQTLNGEKTQTHLCAQCAANSAITMTPISFASFLQGFVDAPKLFGECAQPKQAEASCPLCGQSLTELSRTGKAGCPSCYKTFAPQMAAMIRSVQAGNSKHIGKIPQSAGEARACRELEQYKQKLSEAVAKEEFEEAAKLRDAIRALEGGTADGKMVRGEQ